MHRPDLDAGGRRAAVDRPGRPDRRPRDQTSRNAFCRVALLEHDLHRARRARGSAPTRGSARLRLLGLVRRLPLAVDAGEAARVEERVGSWRVEHLEEVLAEVRVVDRAVRRARPRALEHEAVEREALLGRAAGVEVVERAACAAAAGAAAAART